MTTLTPQQQAIADYLQWSKDPESLRDDEAIAMLEAQRQAATEVLEQLQLESKLAELKDLPEDRFLKPFIENVFEYAQQNNIPAAAFEAMGVKRQHLREAGFEFGKPRQRRHKRSKRHSIEQVIQAIVNSGLSEFTRSQAIQASGASPATVRAALLKMQEDHLIKLTDREDPNHKGRGARAKLYEFTPLNVA